MAGTWVALSNQPSFTANHMMLLTDGTVMVQDVATVNWWRLTPDASGSYVNGSWSARAGSPNGPTYYASAVLMDGRVLMAGGEDNFGNNGVDLDAAEIYDPVADTWTTITTPGWGWIGDAPGCLLPDGRFIMGSINDTRTAIFDPSTNAWTPGPAKNDASSEETWTLLPDSTVLTAEVNSHPAAEKYVPSANSWVSAGSVPADLVLQTQASIEIGPAILMTDGRVFAMGASGHTALYTPPANPGDPGTWAAGPDFPPDGNGQPWRCFDGPAVLLPNGRVLCIAGPATSDGWAGTPCHAFEFDGTTLSQVPDPPNGASVNTWQCRMLLLPTGEVLLSTRSNNIQVYLPDGGPNPAWAPVITSAPSSIRPGGSFTLQGRQLNGLSQANSYGDDAQMATNFPLVRIELGGQVVYCRTHGFSTMGVATGGAGVSAQVEVPSGVPLGSGQLCVIANGIPACVPVAVSNKIIIKDHKDIKDKDIKLEKVEKNEAKEQKDAKIEAKEHKDAKVEKLEKVEVKEHKDAKIEAKEHKDVKIEKLEKELEKVQFDNVGKLKDAETAGQASTQGQQAAGAAPAAAGASPLEVLSAIADALTQQAQALRSFIQASERPPVGEDVLRSTEPTDGP
jgi:Kelch motif